jgi:hypothetical protein
MKLKLSLSTMEPRVAGDDRKESLAAKLKGSRRKAFAVTQSE